MNERNLIKTQERRMEKHECILMQNEYFAIKHYEINKACFHFPSICEEVFILHWNNSIAFAFLYFSLNFLTHTPHPISTPFSSVLYPKETHF
jgi:hypothetical protein